MSQPAPTSSAPQTPLPATKTKVKPPIRFRLRNVLLFLAAGLALVVAAVTAVVVFYIGRSAYQAGHQTSPTEAADGLLYAILHERSESAASKYLCDDGSIKHQVHSMIGQAKRFESSGKSAQYSWGAPHVRSRSTGRATVTVNVGLKVLDGSHTYPYPDQGWILGERNGGGPLGGWHVCSLRITGG